ncbi:MAG: biosynthetic-type acetolactate synthase large subunit [Thaumarchaeota archaeon]|nr:biosynthetic-type acetolactate synthase large subunit [Nitrososphaerota archaeon]MCL5316885.1 biosynthetic-type acetolactate synthase large subunit [Nitrososphaerota archaeon]
MVKMSGSQALIQGLWSEGVRAIFGIPGGQIMPVYDALYDSEIRHILARHEQCAAHMADGYARASGHPGVCMATSGPGATNLVTGIATAYADSSPIVAITGQVAKPFIGKDAFQECDTIGIVTPITKYTLQPMEANEIPEAIKKAFLIASTGRPGPVLVDIPRDVQTGVSDISIPDKVEVRGYKPHVKPHPLQIERAADLLLNADKPMIWSGGGVIIANAAPQLRAIAELLLAPVVTSLIGKGSFPENHPLSLGPIGMHGRPEANKMVCETDCLLAVGVRFSDRSTGRFEEFCQDASIIHIDIDPAELGKNKKPNLPIVADVGIALNELLAAIKRKLAKREETAWSKRVEEIKEQFQNSSFGESKGYQPQIVEKIREILPSNGILTTEVGKNQMWGELYYKVIEPRTWITSTGLGTMGFGFPAAVGAKVAKPDVPVVDLAGDGSFRMTENSLAVCVDEHIPVTVVILNNSSLGMVEQWQRLFHDRRYSAVKLSGSPDFVKLAEAYGAQGFRAQSIEEFEKVFKEAIKSDVATVIDCPVAPEEDVFPFVPPGRGLKDILYGAESA